MIFEVRDMGRRDIAACVAIINHIIAEGGSTAHEEPFNDESFATDYLERPEIANVVIGDDRIVGFQIAFNVKPDVFSIASFTDRINPARGAGAALFAKTQSDCRARGGTSIIAKITGDNTGGLAFYSKMGFQPDEIMHAEFTRADGTVVDRVIKRFKL